MASIPTTDPALAPLRHGERLDQKVFHYRYKTMPPDVCAELIEGVVYMQSALKWRHGRHHAKLMGWLDTYENATPGVEVCDNATSILGEQSEPQPDAAMFIAPGEGGQVTISEDGYVTGAPEFVAEVACSESIDLGGKKHDYQRAGVREYLVLAVRQQQVYWLVNRNGQLEEQNVDENGIYRSEFFPGLWLDPNAWLQLDGRRMREVLQSGIETAEHASFVDRLKSEEER